MELDNIIKEKFNEENIIKYSGMQKVTSLASNYLQFEIIRDLNSPCNQYFPFMFSNKINKLQRFEDYLCFINIEKIFDQLSYIE